MRINSLAKPFAASLIIAAGLGNIPAADAAYFEAAMCADPQPENPDSTGFTFTDVIKIPTTSVKDQNKSGTCWAFSGLSAIEDDVLRKSGKELDLSEMWVVRNAYIDKARKFMRMNGTINFAQGGSFEDVLDMTERYGAVPESAYAGLNYGEEKHSHYEMADALEAYLKAVLNRGTKNKKLTTAWLPGFIGILDAYLGPAPESFVYEGKTYTPQEFKKAMGIAPEDFETYTSFNHHPFYTEFILEIPDNWQWASNRNVPIEDLKAIVDNALENGYSVAWGADVSEGGFKWRKGYAVLPEKKNEADMTDTELSRWVKLSDKDREDAAYDIKGPVKEQTVTQESRQKMFDNFETTDDHGMVIVGTATDQEGNRYYKVKNSWDTNQIYDGFFYVSEPYFLAKTLNVTLNKGGVPKKIADKFKK